MHATNEELQANDGIDDDDKKNQQCYVQKGHHGFHDRVQDNMQTYETEMFRI